MIKDTIENASIYFGLSEDIKSGFEWILNNDLKGMDDGKYIISDRIYANLQTYMTKDDALFEAHRDYIDIQYMINGAENCGIGSYSGGEPAVPYDKGNDIEFIKLKKYDNLNLKSGEFFIFFPQDAHKPALKTENNNMVKKVVVKVKI